MKVRTTSTKELQVKPLSARSGQSYSISLDESSITMLNHAQEYLVRSMNLKVSNAVLVRRALLLLCYHHYDELIEECRKSSDGEGLVDEERGLLEHVSRGSVTGACLLDISPTEAFPTYQERLDKVREIENND